MSNSRNSIQVAAVVGVGLAVVAGYFLFREPALKPSQESERAAPDQKSAPELHAAAAPAPKAEPADPGKAQAAPVSNPEATQGPSSGLPIVTRKVDGKEEKFYRTSVPLTSLARFEARSTKEAVDPQSPEGRKVLDTIAARQEDRRHKIFGRLVEDPATAKAWLNRMRGSAGGDEKALADISAIEAAFSQRNPGAAAGDNRLYEMYRDFTTKYSWANIQ